MESPEVHFTLGPASWSGPVLQEIIAAGAAACRINLSHIQPAQLRDWITWVRAAAQAAGRSIRIGLDLRGRKLRIGPLPGGRITLSPGQRFHLLPVDVHAEAPGGPDHASVNWPTLGQTAQPGDVILLDDGLIRLRVEAAVDGQVTCLVERGGPLPERSGFYLPGRQVTLPPLTPKDEADLDALASLQPDFVYLSYVETGEDLPRLREALARRGLSIPVVAKIERAIALQHLTEIAQAADALCLARGDLGVEVPLPELPLIQRRVIAVARRAGTPALLAGEVMYSLVHRHVPTRAELTDMAVALEQGYAGFVLSDETAIGRDPIAAVRWPQLVAGAMRMREVSRDAREHSPG